MAATRELEAIYESLADRPQHFPDLCCGVSRPLLSALIEQMPRDSLVLSVSLQSPIAHPSTPWLRFSCTPLSCPAR